MTTTPAETLSERAVAIGEAMRQQLDSLVPTLLDSFAAHLRAMGIDAPGIVVELGARVRLELPVVPDPQVTVKASGAARLKDGRMALELGVPSVAFDLVPEGAKD